MTEKPITKEAIDILENVRRLTIELSSYPLIFKCMEDENFKIEIGKLLDDVHGKMSEPYINIINNSTYK